MAHKLSLTQLSRTAGGPVKSIPLTIASANSTGSPQGDGNQQFDWLEVKVKNISILS